MAQAAIERSGALPLHIVVALNGATKHSGGGDFCPLLDLDQPACPMAIRTYLFTEVTSSIRAAHWYHWSPATPSNASLRDRQELANPPYTAFDGAPLLTNATLLAGPLPFASSSLPMSRLQRLEAQFVSPYEVYKYLQEAQSLKSIKICCAIYFMPDESESEPHFPCTGA
ncbi:hypothetical protein HGRIS_013982 [Hohenbuehelia grisea]|uniref:Uncharacterized protein n=1 Tax=Hohenbuehelia grisea TaxID=104357 RepID=A0ABR3JU45_9AGAR